MFDTLLRSPFSLNVARSGMPAMVVLNDLAREVPDGAVADVVAALPVMSMNPLERVEALQTLAEHEAHNKALMLDLVAAIAGRATNLDSAREEVSCALSISGFHAERMVATARALTSRLTATRAAMLAGKLSYEHAVALAHGTRDLSDELARLVEAQLLDRAMTVTPARFAKKVARAAAKADPTGPEVRHARARKDRHIASYPQDDAMASLYAYGPALDVAKIQLACDALARAMADDGRTLAQKRFDALVVMAEDALAQPGLPKRKGRSAQVFIKMTLDAARGLSDEPADLVGYGPIPASAARDEAADGELRAFLVDAATGAFQGLGTKAYRPTRRLDEHIVARDETCSFPHCDQPAETTDTEHAVPHDKGGATDQYNCGPMCRRHHRLKTLGDWQVVRSRDGTVTWTSPLGLTYITDPTD